MGGRVDSRELRRHVVRVDNNDGEPLGTGFFVAPGWVLTCAHVVAGADGVRVVQAEGACPSQGPSRLGPRPASAGAARSGRSPI